MPPFQYTFTSSNISYGGNGETKTVFNGSVNGCDFEIQKCKQVALLLFYLALTAFYIELSADRRPISLTSKVLISL